jgi:tRNA-Thr(GGU) m(6)t(6)A37 methyltransferase TsaA
MFMKIELTPIGIINSPFKEAEGIPIQSVFATSVKGSVEVYPEYEKGLSDLDGFSHIILLYWFHKSSQYTLTCRPFLDTQERGVFATRAPRRPNPIGFSIVELLKVDGRFLTVGSIDIIDQTPLLDIKPYVPDFDVREQVRTGWYEKAQNKSQIVADKRFTC